MTQDDIPSPRRLFWVSLTFLVTILLPATSGALDCYPLQLSLLPDVQFVPKDKSVCGVRLDLLWGKNKSVSGIDFGTINQTASMRGIEIGGVNWLTGEEKKMSWGLQAGVFNVPGNVPFTGVQLGVFNLSEVLFKGTWLILSEQKPINISEITPEKTATLNVIQLSLANATAGNNVNGLQVSFAGNLAQNVTGVQTAIFVNSAQNLNGIQTSYLANAAEGTVNGIQAVILANSARNLNGLQIGIFNNTDEHVNGVQVGIANLARHLRGMHLGFINLAEYVDGLQVGIINLCADLRGMQIGALNMLVPMQSTGAETIFSRASYYPLMRINF